MTSEIKRKPGRPKGTGTNGRRRVLSPDEVKSLKRAADESGLKYALIVRLILELALRVCELARMRVEDFNTSSRPHQVTVKGAKGGFIRAYDIADRLWARYVRWMKVREPQESQWVFPSRLYGGEEHMSMMAIQGTFRTLCRRAGIPGVHSVHDLRHTMATRMAEAGDTGVQIAARLRHRDLRSAEAYIDFANGKEHDKAMLARYED